MPMATKLGKMVTHLDGALPLKPHDPLIKCSSKVMEQTKTNMLWLPEYL